LQRRGLDLKKIARAEECPRCRRQPAAQLQHWPAASEDIGAPPGGFGRHGLLAG
jgi:hypothetical protein